MPAMLLKPAMRASASVTGTTPPILKPGVDFRCAGASCVGLNANTTAKYVALQKAVNRKLGAEVVLETGIMVSSIVGFVMRILGRQNFGLTDLLQRPEEFTGYVVNSSFVAPPSVIPGAGVPATGEEAGTSSGLWWKLGLGGVGVLGLGYFLLKRK